MKSNSSQYYPMFEEQKNDVPDSVIDFSAIPTSGVNFIIYQTVNNCSVSHFTDYDSNFYFQQSSSTKDVDCIENSIKEEADHGELYERFKIEAIAILRTEVPEAGLQSDFELFLQNQIEMRKDKTLAMLQKLFYEYIHDPIFLIGILHAISHMDYSLGNPHFQMIALASLVNKNEFVVDHGIRAFENWENPDAINALEHVVCRNPLIENYRKNVIEFLKANDECMR